MTRMPLLTCQLRPQPTAVPCSRQSSASPGSGPLPALTTAASCRVPGTTLARARMHRKQQLHRCCREPAAPSCSSCQRPLNPSARPLQQRRPLALLSNVAGMPAQTQWRTRLQQQHCRMPVRAQAYGQMRPPMQAWQALGLEPGSCREDVRAAYLERIRTQHPDVNKDAGAHADSVSLNLAYEQLMQAFADGGSEFEAPLYDAFDVTDGEPDQLFVDPFAAGINPLDWRLLQETARSGSDAEQALWRAGVRNAAGALHYLTPAQLADVEAELTAMEDSFAFDTAAWYVADCLARARRANARMQGAARRW